MTDEIISDEQIKRLDALFDEWEGVSIQTDQDYRWLGEMFNEDE